MIFFLKITLLTLYYIIALCHTVSCKDSSGRIKIKMWKLKITNLGEDDKHLHDIIFESSQKLSIKEEIDNLNYV